MPYGTNPWMDVGGSTAGMNQSMANIALMQRQAQYRMQQMAAQQALEQQKLAIDRQAEERMGRGTDSTINYQAAEGRRADAETKKYGTENEMVQATMARQSRGERLKGYEGSPDIMSMVQDPFSGPQIMGDLRAANVAPQGQFQWTPQQLIQAIHGALGAQAFGQSMGTAASAERLTEPYMMGPNQNAVDPFSRQVIAQTGPAAMNPYQRQNLDINQQRADEQARHNQRQEDLRFREVAGRNVGELGRGFQTGDLMEDARRAFAQSMGTTYTPQPPTTNAPAPPTDDRGFFGRLFNTGQGQGPKTVRTKAEYDALPSGTHYIDPNGKQAIKP